MARWEHIDGWDGAVRFETPAGRRLIAAPRGLLPHHPYLMDSLRPPRPAEQEEIGGEARLVLDVTEAFNVEKAIARRRLYCAPWNAYFVLRPASGDVLVAHLVRTGLRRLLLPDATAVALAAGYDVAGWPAEVDRGRVVDRWIFSRPDNEAVDVPSPVLDHLVLSR